MDIHTAKNIQLADYLQSLGYHPVKQQGNSLWYNSPLRAEKEPSFKVNLDRNLWYDFGMGKGGNIIALAQELYQSNDIPYLLDRIAEQSPNVRPASFSFSQKPLQPSGTPHIEIVPLSSPALFAYLQERRINTELAKRECKELRSFREGKPYFAIAFPNASGGYEIRYPNKNKIQTFCANDCHVVVSTYKLGFYFLILWFVIHRVLQRIEVHSSIF